MPDLYEAIYYAWNFFPQEKDYLSLKKKIHRIFMEEVYNK